MALDQRGHGDSDWAPDADYSIAAQREDVKGFAEAVGLENFVLVGMSMGAINGLAYAIEYPETLSALVLIDAGPNVRRPGSTRIRDFVNGGAKPETLEAIIERALAVQPAPRSADPAAQPDAQSAPPGGRQLGVEIRPAALSGDGRREARARSAAASPTGWRG